MLLAPRIKTPNKNTSVIGQHQGPGKPAPRVAYLLISGKRREVRSVALENTESRGEGVRTTHEHRGPLVLGAILMPAAARRNLFAPAGAGYSHETNGEMLACVVLLGALALLKLAIVASAGRNAPAFVTTRSLPPQSSTALANRDVQLCA